MPKRLSKLDLDPNQNSSAPTTTRRQGKREKRQKLLAASEKRALTKAEIARKDLGLTDEEMRGVPIIASLLYDACGGQFRAVELLRSDDNAESIRFVQKWDSLSRATQRNARFEDIIIAAGLTPRRFTELLAGTMMEQSAVASKIFVAMNQVKVFKSLVKAATDEVPILADTSEGRIVVGKTNGDVTAMKIFHTITGAMPTPKGSQTTINLGRGDDSPREQSPLQSMDSFLMEIDDVRKPRQLNAPKPEIPVEMPAGVPEIEYLSIDE